VTDAAAYWATTVVTHLTRRLVFQAARHISENRVERLVKRIGRIIEESGPQGITKSKLTLVSRWAGTRERDEYLDTLIQCGEIALVTIPTGRRPRNVYTHRRFLKPEPAALS
jgi:hypothetical protein